PAPELTSLHQEEKWWKNGAHRGPPCAEEASGRDSFGRGGSGRAAPVARRVCISSVGCMSVYTRRSRCVVGVTRPGGLSVPVRGPVRERTGRNQRTGRTGSCANFAAKKLGVTTKARSFAGF